MSDKTRFNLSIAQQDKAAIKVAAFQQNLNPSDMLVRDHYSVEFLKLQFKDLLDDLKNNKDINLTYKLERYLYLLENGKLPN